MKKRKANNHKEEFIKIYQRLILTGKKVAPRGLKVLESENFHYELSPYIRFVNFKVRKLNLNYIKREFLWYLRGYRFDDSIIKYAKLWKEMINKDGSINSNYGQYIFSRQCSCHDSQFDNVIKMLKKDKDSRRASIVILNREHLISDTNDVPCTYSLNFRIRKNFLNMSVHMRSQDAVYGFSNDVPAFSFIHEMILNVLKERYPVLKYGMYHHTTDSFHVYEKHYLMLENITGYPIIEKEKVEMKIDDSFELIKCPKISGKKEVDFLRKLNFSKIPAKFKFSKWLNTIEQ